MQSGTAFSSWALSSNPVEMAFKLGEVLGIKTTDSAELVNKLKELSPKDLVDASREMAKSLVKDF